MKKHTTIALLFLTTTLLFAQNKEKIKGSKKVTTEQREIGPFSSIEIEDNIEVYLELGEKPEIKIEADDNLQNIISIDIKDKKLNVQTLKEAIRFKKLIVKITYTKDLNLVSSKNDATINAIQEVQLDSITFKSFDASELFLNVNSKHFQLESNDKSKVELNLKSEKSKIVLSQNASLKALITTTDLITDLYQKSEAKIEGTATVGLFRIDSNSNLTANNLTVKNIEITAEGDSNCSVNALTNIIIVASGKSEIELYGDPKIEMKKFTDEAKLIKKTK
ncbi:GIN domain-containing protein [Flavobacterium frigoris]|uniref:Putative auto-transporter adhesin head GIN domain-containing protein n=1 Tax=Flavobacterium frigoris (strain PS1) TaxID=1086011 RepID=H7FLY2_FLAFP|nr:DUF2807 domain-containing protein [Flavobacterium frigoris]EIA10440.1 hypothetical protein HJ01_00180 [Flavobacterium frigoris PS1]